MYVSKTTKNIARMHTCMRKILMLYKCSVNAKKSAHMHTKKLFSDNVICPFLFHKYNYVHKKINEMKKKTKTNINRHQQHGDNA